MLFKRFAHIVPFMERNLVLKVINGLWQTFTLGYPTWRCSKSSAKFLHRDSPIKRASRASALRADGVPRTMGLVLTQPISPTPWTRPQNPLGANSSLTIRLLKKDVITDAAKQSLSVKAPKV